MANREGQVTRYVRLVIALVQVVVALRYQIDIVHDEAVDVRIVILDVLECFVVEAALVPWIVGIVLLGNEYAVVHELTLKERMKIEQQFNEVLLTSQEWNDDSRH